jgi:hypothetical protein
MAMTVTAIIKGFCAFLVYDVLGWIRMLPFLLVRA